MTMMNTELREWIAAQRKTIESEAPGDYERGQLDTLDAIWQQTSPPRETRFTTETMLVYGDTPGEIETEARMRVSALTGIGLADLAIAHPYTLCSAANYENVTPSALRPEAQIARMKGKAHWAQISVRAYRGAGDDDGAVLDSPAAGAGPDGGSGDQEGDPQQAGPAA